MFAGYHHDGGDHCGSASLRNLASYYEWGFDEAACFGLGAGLGFSYRESEIAARMIMGRSVHLETAFFDALGIDVTQREGQSEKAAWAALERRLESGPVVCFVDLYYLPYFGSDTHFGPHTIVVVDVTADDVTISDSEFADPQTVSRDAFDDAWSSAHGFWPLRRRWLAVDDPSPAVATETATHRATERAAKTMLGSDPESEQGGVAAIRAFADDLPTWNALADVQWVARFAYQNVERRGTGGGAFRRLYATFLDTLGTDAGLDSAYGERMHRIADDWTSLGAILRTVSETDGAGDREAALTEASELAHDIADREAALFADLDGAV